MGRIPVLLALVAVASPCFVSAQEIKLPIAGQYPEIFLDTCLCFDTLIVVPDGSMKLHKSVYEKAIAFWNEQKIGVVFKFAKKFKPEQRDYVVVVQRTTDDLRQESECMKGWGCTFAQFREGPVKQKNERFGGYRHFASFILVHGRFLESGQLDEQSYDLSHEMGHVLGLAHVDATLMQARFTKEKPRAGFILTDRQREALRALYPLK